MNKYIFIFFLLNNVIHGMENEDILGCITESICKNHAYARYDIRKDIKSLYGTNKLLHNYYAQEENAQKIVRLCSRYSTSDEWAAFGLGCWKIKKKIEYFDRIVRDPEGKLTFTQEDLKEPWYLNCTTMDCCRSLVYLALDFQNFDKARLIIENSPQLDFDYDIHPNVLHCMLTKLKNKRLLRYKKEDFEKKMLEIVELLLQKKMDPNITVRGYTPLQHAVQAGNKDLFRLLLRYGANPSEKYTFSLEGSNRTVEVNQCFSGWALDIIQYNR